MTDLNKAYRIAREVVGDDPEKIGRALPKLLGWGLVEEMVIDPQFDEQERMEWRVRKPKGVPDNG